MYQLQYANGSFVRDSKYSNTVQIFNPESKELSQIISVPESVIYFLNVEALVPLEKDRSVSITNTPPGSKETDPFSTLAESTS